MRKVALLIETSNSYARGLMRGISAYLREHERWLLYLSEGKRGEKVPSWLEKWKGDGIIVRIENEEIAKVIKKLKIPVVDISSARLIPDLRWVETDDKGVAELAANHFIHLGFRNFAFCGDRSFNWSIQREQHFQRLISKAGYKCHVFNYANQQEEASETQRIAKWLVDLPKPLGLFSSYDYLGRQVLEACRGNEITVPDQVSVLGVDNDDIMCELSEPPMSSVIPNTHLVGYKAAELLERLMSGEHIPSTPHLIMPIGIAARRSTDVLAIEDRNTVASLRYIREHACRGISVKDVIDAVPQSRRLLESKFKKFLGRTPHEEIISVRIRCAKTLLLETELPLTQIAERTGFTHVEYLNVAFRRETGMPPGRYRHVNSRGPRSLYRS